jgi:alpha-L-arabinofuranosidase
MHLPIEESSKIDLFIFRTMRFSIPYRINFIFLNLALLSLSALTLFGEDKRTTLKIKADAIEVSSDRHRLISTNLSLWTPERLLSNPSLNAAVRDWKPALIRMPGGSWANEYYWNGNGVRLGNDHGLENFDATKQNPDGSWKIDFSDYTPGFRVEGEERHLSDYHGDIDVKTQHSWIQEHDADAFVTVNLGSGSPRLAAEWVHWANQKEDYDVRYWELGNELSGDWELGHRLPDGSSMTGAIYTKRYLEYAAAMRAVDSELKLGGPASPDIELDFMEALIRDGGKAVDYLSFHAYPVGVSLRDTQKKFEAIETVRTAIQKIRKWIQTYQPTRQDEIEIGISEWNIKVNEDQDTADLISALWSAAFIGMLFEEGVDFANQWDLVTQVEKGGHSAFYHDPTQVTPKSQYWGLWMWGQLMGNELVHSKLKTSPHLQSFVTRSSEGLQIMCINTSESKTAQLKLEIESSKKLNPNAQLHQFSSAHYFWDPHANQPRWSQPPSAQVITLSKKSALEIPPFSINVIQIPWQEIKLASIQTADTQAPTQEQQVAPSLQLLLPQRVPADRPIKGWLIAQDRETKNPALDLQGSIQINVTAQKRKCVLYHSTQTRGSNYDSRVFEQT